MVAISVDSPERHAEYRTEEPDLPCLLASDAERTALTSLDLLHHSGRKILAAPANILVDAKGVVRWTYYSNVVMDRCDPATVMTETRKILD